ncbi:MAG: helix-turn-helix transcriptional regulator, partial [Verrucomicrobiota bacterium]|nr:helix-turn-helix transcriptional regulator [Verrucomicrobiota bacterium]
MRDRFDLGDILTSTRESRDWSIEDVSHRTRIPQTALRQLENNDYSKFPSLTYARSFLAQYCDHLDIHAVECLAHFETGDSLSDLDSCGYLKDHDERVNARPLVMK